MARQKGTLSLSSNIEPSMNAPLDARQTVNLLADLTASGSFPYYYEGMIVSCKENHKVYQLIGSDPTVSANWQQVGSGGGGGSGEDVTNLFTVHSGIVLDSGFTYKAYRVGDVVVFNCHGTITSGFQPVGTNFTLFDIDESIKPSVSIDNWALGAGSSSRSISATTGGAINTNVGGWISGTITWII